MEDPFVRKGTRNAILFAILLLPLSTGGTPAADNPVEPAKFFQEFVGLNDDQVREIRDGKAVAKILDSPTADQVFVFGSVYINSTPERYLKFASDIDALRKLPNHLAQQMALQALLDYQHGGNAALGTYRDKNHPAVVAETFTALINRSKGLPVYLPELREYLLNYPKADSANIESQFYWEKVNFGLKPTIR